MFIHVTKRSLGMLLLHRLVIYLLAILLTSASLAVEGLTAYYSDVIMGAMASQINNLASVYSTV